MWKRGARWVFRIAMLIPGLLLVNLCPPLPYPPKKLVAGLFAPSQVATDILDDFGDIVSDFGF